MCTDCEAIMSHISCIEEDGPDKVINTTLAHLPYSYIT